MYTRLPARFSATIVKKKVAARKKRLHGQYQYSRLLAPSRATSARAKRATRIAHPTYNRPNRRAKSYRYTLSRRRSASRRYVVRSTNLGTMPQQMKPFSEIWHETLRDEELMPGVRYKHYIISTGSKHSIHVIEVDRTKPNVGIGVWKAHNILRGLAPLSSIAQHADSLKPGALQAMMSANFWHPYYKTPLGHTVMHGEVVEMAQHKSWSSCFFDRQNRLYIERFTITATLRTRETSFPIETVNNRTSANGVVLYNRYAGTEVPVSPSIILEKSELAVVSPLPSKFKPQKAKVLPPYVPTDEAPTLSQIRRSHDIQHRMFAAERPLYKAVLLYASPPAINEEIPCRVVEIDTGIVSIPRNGVVISFGRNIDESELPRPGDKVSLIFRTNVYSHIPFIHALSGTPRLVRNGIPKHEAIQEGSTRYDFIAQKLPRTAIGTNSQGTTLYFVTADPTDPDAGTTGMTLKELAEGMRQIGAYHALNLHSSELAPMLVRGDIQMSAGATILASVGLGIVHQDPSDQRLFPPRRRLITKPIRRTSGTQPTHPSSSQQSDTDHHTDEINIQSIEGGLSMQELSFEKPPPDNHTP
ncbi:MAG: phosphodiester glycosidase family protein [Bacteroidota bacterium]|nr:phosphodiester glycosidase family protein [Candidatus Kapabacteria bacterium]MDW8220493.1 phosphodiester glycosidase family protein [Bacteroidota bacterium]